MNLHLTMWLQILDYCLFGFILWFEYAKDVMPYYWLSKGKIGFDMPEISKEKLKGKKEKKVLTFLSLF